MERSPKDEQRDSPVICSNLLVGDHYRGFHSDLFRETAWLTARRPVHFMA